MKLTLEPNGPFPPSPMVAANIRAVLDAARVAVGDAPDLQAGESLTVWFDPETGDVKFYTGVTPVPFQLRNAIVSATAPADPVNGVQWLNSNDGNTYTWYNGAWVASESAFAFGVGDMLAMLRDSTVAPEAPEAPTPGQQWFNPADDTTYTWYDGEWRAGETALAADIVAINTALTTIRATAGSGVITNTASASVNMVTGHVGSRLRFVNVADAKTYTVGSPANVPIGATVELWNAGTTTLTVVAGEGITLNFSTNSLSGTADTGLIRLRKVAAFEWDVE